MKVKLVDQNDLELWYIYKISGSIRLLLEKLYIISNHVVFHHSIFKQGSTGSFTTGLCAKRYFRAGWDSDHLLASGAARKCQRCGDYEDPHCTERLCRTGTPGHGEDCICVNLKCRFTFFVFCTCTARVHTLTYIFYLIPHSATSSAHAWWAHKYTCSYAYSLPGPTFWFLAHSVSQLKALNHWNDLYLFGFQHSLVISWWGFARSLQPSVWLYVSRGGR